MTTYEWPSREEWAHRRQHPYWDSDTGCPFDNKYGHRLSDYATAEEIAALITAMKALWRDYGRKLREAKRAAGSLCLQPGEKNSDFYRRWKGMSEAERELAEEPECIRGDRREINREIASASRSQSTMRHGTKSCNTAHAWRRCVMSEITWAEGVADRREQLTELLTEERKARKIRQQELARKLHQPQSRISRIENGECHIDVAEFLALADAIGFDPGMALRKIQGAAGNGGCALAEALAIVEAAGYRVAKVKPKTPKHKDRVGPTFAATFSDGTTVRMTTHTPVEKLDWDRGECLARHAWASRHKALTEAAPPIVACRFEQDGRVLAQRNSGTAP
jgi:transcriptional regulator with XRE-family HTH domain